MGEVLGFPAKGAPTDQRNGSFHDPDNWRVSKKGNHYTRIGEFCVTTFPAWNGWKYSIVRSAREGPMYSQTIYDSEQEARRGAWHALAGMMEQSA